MAQLTTKGRLETKLEQLRAPQIGIVGGCLSTGSRNVGLDSVYHRIVRRETREKTGIELRFRLAREDVSSARQMAKTVSSMISDYDVDVVLFHIRSFLVWGLHVPVWRELGTKGIRGLALNPYLRSSEQCLNLFFPVVRWPGANLLLGKLLQLSRICDQEIERLVCDLNRLCLDSGVDLIVMGPIMGPAYPLSFRSRCNRRLASLASRLEINYVNFGRISESSPEEYFAADGTHPTAATHRLVADLLGERLRERMMPGG